MMLTRRQRDCLIAIREITDGFGHPPTLSDIAAHMGLRNRSTAFAHVEKLSAMGLATHEKGKYRTIALTDLGREEAV